MADALTEDLKTATLGQPFQVAMVRADRLAAYRPGQMPSSLIESPAGLIVPLLDGGTVKTAALIKNTGDELSVVGLGEQRLAQLVRDLAPTVVQQHGIPTESLSLVRIPGLSLAFLARTDGTEIRECARGSRCSFNARLAAREKIVAKCPYFAEFWQALLVNQQRRRFEN